MRTYSEAQQLETAGEVQFMRPQARIRCDIARCRERATHLIGRAQTGRSNLWAICDKHAEELAKNLPEHLLPFVPQLNRSDLGSGDGQIDDKEAPVNESNATATANAPAGDGNKPDTQTPPQSATASQVSASDEGDPSGAPGIKDASTAPEYVRECCGQTFTDKDEYRNHRRHDCKEKGNA